MAEHTRDPDEGPDPELERLRREFIDELPKQAKALEAALLLIGPAPAEGRAAVRRLAHQLRGAGGTYGYPELSDAATEAEEAPAEALEDRVADLTATIRRIVRRVRRKTGRRRPRKAARPTMKSQGVAAEPLLVVEDDPTVARLLQVVLRATGREIVVASTATEASRLVGERRFALIMLDLHLPDGDGRRLLTEWRALPATQDVALFVMSADLGPEAKAECFAAGADAFFEKPLRREVIDAAVRARLAGTSSAAAPRPVPTTRTASAPAGSSGTASDTAARRPSRALVVEDDHFVGSMVRHRLTRAGFSVHHATDGVAGLVASREFRPDLIVLDLNLPEMNGFQLLEQLRTAGPTHDTPIIILTASGAEKDLVRAFTLGANDYLVKPFSPTELLARVQRLAGPDALRVSYRDKA